MNARSNYFVSNIHIISANGVGISTTTGINNYLYEQILNSHIGTRLKRKRLNIYGLVSIRIDDILLQNKEYNTDSYAISLIRKFSDSRGYIILIYLPTVSEICFRF